MLQADDEDDAMDQQMKSPFGSSFRTFDATDYKPISKASLPLTVGQIQYIYIYMFFSYVFLFFSHCGREEEHL